MAGDKRKLVLDADVGIDDALAIIYLAARDEVELVAVGSVHGNCGADIAAENALRVLAVCGWEGVPVALGAMEPLEGTLSVASFVHGEDGLGDAGLPAAKGKITDESAVDQLLRLGAEQPGELDLLAIGPLTNLGLAIQRDPEVLARYRSVTIMGGWGPFPAAGVWQEEDANTDHDPAAAKLVYAAPRQQMTMVGVNVTTPAILDEAAIAVIERSSTPQARLATQILPCYARFFEQQWGRPVCSLHDPLAAGVLVDPSYATATVNGPVNVFTDGAIARATLMQRADGSAPNQAIEPVPDTTVVTAADAERFSAELVRSLVEPIDR